MQFSTSDIAGILAAFSSQITIGTVETTGVFDDRPYRLDNNGATIITDNPTLLITLADADLVEKNSTIITIDGTDYQAFQKTPDGSGFVSLDLTRDF